MQSPLSWIATEEYLLMEQTADVRHEYVAGQIYAMAGASEAHNLIVTNLVALLRPHIRGSSCRVFSSDMKVKIQTASSKSDFFYYPDLLVTCDPQDDEPYFKTKPTLIVEVLSESTKTTDRREKRANYQQIPSLQEYILISQDKINIEIYRRDDDGNWTMKVVSFNNQPLQLNSLGLSLTTAEIYEDVAIA